MEAIKYLKKEWQWDLQNKYTCIYLYETIILPFCWLSEGQMLVGSDLLLHLRCQLYSFVFPLSNRTKTKKIACRMNFRVFLMIKINFPITT